MSAPFRAIKLLCCQWLAEGDFTARKGSFLRCISDACLAVSGLSGCTSGAIRQERHCQGIAGDLHGNHVRLRQGGYPVLTLLEQIQRDAIDPNVRVSDLLRRVKLAAAKLDLGAVEDWVDHELNGYKAEVPAYREVHGYLMAFNPFRGWIPVVGKLVEELPAQNISQSVAG